MLRQKKLLAVAGLLLLVFPSVALAQAQVTFSNPTSYPVGTAPSGVAAGDFNGDGKVDLSVANSGNPAAGDDGNASILLGNGDGTFQAAVNFAAGKNPSSLAVGDFNGDNRLDLAVINGDGGVGKVGVLLGNGDGTFQAPVDYAIGNGPGMVAVGDFNGDHRPDLVVENVLDATVSVLLGNGDGTFQTQVDYGVGGIPQGVVVADFNGDGNADLALPSTSSGVGVAVLLGNGDGTFQAAVFYDPGPPGGPTAVAAGDFNNDGKLDLIVDFFVSVSIIPPKVNRRLDLLVGNGDGTFQLVKGVVAEVSDGMVSQAADFNGDAKLDLVQSSGLVLPGNGDGTFQPAVNFAVGSSPGQVASLDLNDDKSPDIVVTHSGDNTISVLLNTVGTDFSISASALNPGTVSRGQSSTSTVTLGLLNAFDNPVSLTCSVHPVQAGSPACTFSPNPAVFDAGGNATAQLTISTGTAAPLARQRSQSWHWVWLPVAGFALTGWGRRSTRCNKRGLMLFLLSSLVFTGLIFQAACSGSGSSGGGPTSTTYTITVTGTSGSTQRSATVTLTVQ